MMQISLFSGLSGMSEFNAGARLEDIFGNLKKVSRVYWKCFRDLRK